MTRSSQRRWASFWALQEGPLNRSESEEHYREFGAELSLLLADTPARRVLEVACGDGALYTHLGFDSAERYLGVDFSERILESFRERHGDVDLVCAPAESFHVDERFDLIFSSALAQFLDDDQLADHIAHAASMLDEGGRIVIASNPWRPLRWRYARGDLTEGGRRALLLALAAHGRRLWHDNMGHWHDYPDVTRPAQLHSLDVSFHGSLMYPYRFHAVLTRRS